MMDWLFPIKTGKTIIDVNTIFHLAFWIWMGSNFWFMKLEVSRALLVGVCMSFVWEIFERYAERKWPAIWQHPESILNAYISDPLTCIIGVLFAWWALDNWS